MNATERARADDRAWFAAHPDATARVRAYMPGEFAGRTPAHPGGFVLVRQYTPDVRTREYVNPPTGTTRDRSYLYDIGSGAVLQELGSEVWQ